MSGDDAMRAVSAETQQLIDEVNDHDYGFIGPYEKIGHNEIEIEKLLLDHGLYIDSDADCVRFIEDDEHDEEVREGMCSGCECVTPFTILPDEQIEGDPDPDWVYWACKMCGCAPANPDEMCDPA